METKDIFITPIYILLFYLVAIRIKNKKYKNTYFEQYFIKSLTLKFIGALGAGLIYNFYYTTMGDSLTFFGRGLFIYNKLISSSFPQNLIYIFPNSTYFIENANFDDLRIVASMRAYSDPSSYFVSKAIGIISIFCFGTFSCVALFFAFFSFLGSLKLYDVIRTIYPNESIQKNIIYAIFFIPSVFFWGSGIFKDSITFACIGYLTFYLINSNAKKLITQPLNITIILFLSSVVLTIKGYILLSFLPCVFFYYSVLPIKKIKSNFVKYTLLPVLIFIGIISAIYAITLIGQTSGYSVDNLEKKAYDMQNWHSSVQNTYGEGGGSHYSIGNVGDFTLSNLLVSFPLSVNVTLFRPYLWEANSPIMLINSLESLFFFMVTIRLFWKYRFNNILNTIIGSPFILLCFLFSIIFAFAVGFTSFNFGALVRYKIPCLPFYLLFIFLTEYELKTKLNNEKS